MSRLSIRRPDGRLAPERRRALKGDAMRKACLAVLVLLAWGAGCRTVDERWTTEPAKVGGSPWGRVIARIDLSDASLSNSVALIQRLANESGAPDITVHVADAPDPSAFFTTISEFSETIDDLHAPHPISVALQLVTVRDALHYLAELANCTAFYRGNEAVLVPNLRHYGHVPVRFEGHARSRGTAEGVGRFSLVSTWRHLACCDNGPFTSIDEVATRRDGAFSLTLLLPGYAYVAGSNYIVSIHPKHQAISFIAIADDHYPNRCTVDLVESNLQYRLDFELEP